MRPFAPRVLLIASASVLALVFLAYLLAEAWLESAGGRQAVERALADRVGMPVRLEGKFSVMLLPAIGVSGTGLVLGEPGSLNEVARGGEYAVVLALRPLLERRLVIESVSLKGGVLRLQRWPERPADARREVADGVQPPEIGRLEIQDFEVIREEGEGNPLLVRDLLVEGFGERRDTRFRLDVPEAAAATGTLWWDPEGRLLRISTSLTGQWPGAVTLRTEVSLGAASGTLDASWSSGLSDPGVAPEVSLSLTYAWGHSGVQVDSIELSAGPLTIHGDGCLLFADPASLNLELSAGQLDLDALPDLSAVTSRGGKDAQEAQPGIEFNIRLAADEIRKSEVVARQAVLSVGREPDCGALSAGSPEGAVSGGIPEVSDPIQ